MNLLNSFLLDCCPKDSILTDIPASTCPENLGQIQRYWFVRKYQLKWDIQSASPGTNNYPNAVIGTNAPSVAAGWTALFALTSGNANESSHVVATPLIGGDSTIAAGDTITQGGGDNSTLSGEQLVNGINPSTGNARFDSLTGAQILALRKLACEGSDLEVYMISQEGKIWGQKVGDLFTGFDCQNVVLGSMNNNGFGTRDNNTLTFQLPFDYDETKHAITPSNFNALTI
tara:strand:- start:4349 stop:5038 length:690 start_codon:yes stop_codon:yes gene_type:complete